jgi:hypothetical protein
MTLKIQHFFDPKISTLSYVVHDGRTGVVIDPVRDFDPKNGRTSWSSSEQVAAYVAREQLAIPYVMLPEAETNGTSYLKIPLNVLGGR